ncbi:hypothetical protein M413DRAFT_32993 [Hebeloma cylindrosporum]|uniref:Anaphase-promoting complex subunit 4 WD40 domain-containing protein n=1 Tax=Hebeloma cylindrosporum TaxID=76867 RepID=A0A0C3BTY2_HEBCY|nr:hypothetical protein M413DRAFT_32993 [Hebeloma cylindrosporum h7]
MFEKLSNVIDLALGRPQVTTLKGPVGPVNSLSISPSGNFLASTDGVKIWDLTTLQEVTISRHHARERTQISCVSWLNLTNDLALDTLCYGNIFGYLVFLQRRQDTLHFQVVHSARVARGGEIICIATCFSEEGPVRLATSTRDKCVQIWNFDIKAHVLSPIHSKMYEKEKDIVPKALAFDSNHDLFVFDLYDGGIYKYSSKDAKVLSHQALKSMIGNAAVDLSKRMVVVDNLSDGMDLYNLDTAEYMETFLTRRTSANVFPKSVAFANQSRAVVGGSDHGIVYIFDRKSGHVIHSLKYAKKGGVETLAVQDSRKNDCVLLAAASSTCSEATYIRIWKWKPKEKVGTTSTPTLVFRVAMIILIVFAIILFRGLTVLWQDLNFSTILIPATEDTPKCIDFTVRIPARWLSS